MNTADKRILRELQDEIAVLRHEHNKAVDRFNGWIHTFEERLKRAGYTSEPSGKPPTMLLN